MQTTAQEIRTLTRAGEWERAARLAERLATSTLATGYVTREAWLEGMVDALRPRFAELGAPLPAKVRVSVGFPSKRPLAKKNRRVGECWHKSLDPEGAPHVFISPLLTEEEAAECLAHELIHTACPEAGHKGEFKRVALALGLKGPMTATVAGEALKGELATIRARLGAYPHKALDAKVLEEEHEKKKDGTRQRKGECGCGRIIRMSRKVAEEGPVLCGLCRTEFVVDLGDEDAGE